MRWTGPGTEPDRQYSVDVSVLKADRSYRRLRQRGLLDAHRLADILGCVDRWADSEPHRDVLPGDRFVIAIEVLKRVLHPTEAPRFVARDRDPQARYGELTAVVQDIVGDESSIVLVDNIWLLARLIGYSELPGPHRFVAADGPINVDCSSELDQLRTCAYPRAMHFHLTQFVESAIGDDRVRRGVRDHSKNHYLCAHAHLFRTARFSLGKSKNGGCGYCARARPYPGFNTLADTHPSISAEWDYEANGELRPEHLLAGSPQLVKWRCAAKNHQFPQTPAARTAPDPDGCPYCSNKKVDPRYNSLSFTDPQIAAGWHPTRNLRHTPDTVARTDRHAVWWVCEDEGHDFWMKVRTRVAGGRCDVCRMRRVHPSNCLAATHEHLIELWHPTRNGELTPFDVMAGQPTKVWWRCNEDPAHEYPQRINRKTLGDGCPHCYRERTRARPKPRKRKNAKPRKGRPRRPVSPAECMRSTHPELADEFDTQKNAPITPENIRASTRLRLHWRCVRGHGWPATGGKRVAGSGCGVCKNKIVLAGYNDLATTAAHLLPEWDFEMNELLPTEVVKGTGKPIHWKCVREGHRWQEPGRARLKRKRGCAECYRAAHGRR